MMMVFKNDWEKTETHTTIDEAIILAMVKQASKNELLSYDIISGGCANLNYKLNLRDEPQPQILRVYLRDPETCYIEQEISLLVRDKIPVANYFYVGEFGGFNFALTEYLSGITLRELLLSHPEENSEEIMYEAGTMLAQISSYKFESAGFFDRNLSIKSPISKEWLLEYTLGCLQHNMVQQQLEAEQLKLLNSMFVKYADYFPGSEHHSLVHADYDPANILVDKIAGKWRINAVLDWEFALSGSSLCDVSNMLRYAHLMPASFEQYFLQGLKDGGFVLPHNWRISIYLLNLLSLLDCLAHAEPSKRPKQCKDIVQLIGFFTGKLSQTTF
jgi:Ser/Thr protein kinase RdoA (MazF antagonist)